MEVFVRFDYNGTPLTSGMITISDKPERVFYEVKLDEPVIKLLERINEVYLYSKQNRIIAPDATIKEVKQLKSENKSYFSMFNSTYDNLLESQNKMLSDVLTLEPGKRVILDVKFTGSPIEPRTSVQSPTQGGRKSRKSRKSRRR